MSSDFLAILKFMIVYFMFVGIIGIITFIDYKFTNHNYNWYGFKENINSWGLFYSLFVLGVFLFGFLFFALFVQWFWLNTWV